MTILRYPLLSKYLVQLQLSLAEEEGKGEEVKSTSARAFVAFFIFLAATKISIPRAVL
jgi:hypothetical protein